ncbi:ROK family protein [Glaciibacter superstes]|uniref:ROK family protein n=1 Tax=Glaciibacter superstes TaxID=501023 RepID=UPI0003B47F22|nr:ROK family protein [Glaciibacter superstes]
MPVLEIGGTHVTAALVDGSGPRIREGTVYRTTIRSHGSAEEILDDVGRAIRSLPSLSPSEWVVAIPSPFDYEAGVGQFENVGKFDGLRGVDLRAALTKLIEPAPIYVHFVNDGDAYGIGEYAVGAGRGFERLVCITLGTGVGSAFLIDGEAVTEGARIPKDGMVHVIEYDGAPLEETVSRRAIRSAYAVRAGVTDAEIPDVREIASFARSGDLVAGEVLAETFRRLGDALAGVVLRFEADALVIGGSMSRSWDLIEPALRRGLVMHDGRLAQLPVLQAKLIDDAPIVGAAYWATRHHVNR